MVDDTVKMKSAVTECMVTMVTDLIFVLHRCFYHIFKCTAALMA